MIEACSKSQVRLREIEAQTLAFASKIHVSPLVALFLEMRGFSGSTEEAEVKARAWLNPSLDLFSGCVDLGREAEQAATIFKGWQKGQRVIVYGDYDVDGVCTTLLALELCLLKGMEVRYFIPHRFKEGYGFHADLVRAILRRGCDAMLVVDCGSKDTEAAELLRQAGVPLLVFDHHLVEGELAKPQALVNPQREGDPAAKDLCAAAVFWFWAANYALAPREWLYKRLDLVALATVADCVPMNSTVNRILVREGLQQIRGTERPGLSLLLDKLAISRESLDEELLAMRVIPCLNAAGRLKLADVAVNVLSADRRGMTFVDDLVSLNRKRRDLATSILSEVGTLDAKDPDVRVYSTDHWPVGVLSGVASRLCGEKKAPIVLAAPAGNLIRGTLRMPSGGDAMAILREFSKELRTWGGHRLAAGFSVEREKWPFLKDRLEQALQRVVIPEKPVEAALYFPEELTFSLWEEVRKLGPFGVANPQPCLYCPQKGPLRMRPLGREGKHVAIEMGESSLLAFGAHELLGKGELLPINGWIYRPKRNTFRSNPSLDFIVDKMVVSSNGF